MTCARFTLNNFHIIVIYSSLCFFASRNSAAGQWAQMDSNATAIFSTDLNAKIKTSLDETSILNVL